MRGAVGLGVLLGCLALATSCRPTVGTFDASAYVHPNYAYQVRYSDAASQSLMPEGWELDNLYKRRRKFESKKGADYVARLFLDANRDGQSDDLGEFPIFDLRFVHKKHSGVIWLRTVPLPLSEGERELRGLLANIVEGISGGGSRVVQLEGELWSTNRQSRYAAKAVESTGASVAGLPAHQVVVDVSNVDTLKVDPKNVEMRITLVAAHTAFRFEPSGYHAEFPVLLLAGYANAPTDFDAGVRDFQELLSRIEIDGKSGYRKEASGSAAPPTSEVATAPPGSPTAPVAKPLAPSQPPAADAGLPDAAGPDATSAP
ncbi:MAG: hypothetical protein R3B13_19235 [Polyangiaceae bacterium]